MTKEITKPDYSKMNIYQKLVEVKRHIKGLSKDGKSGSGNFSYTYITPSKVYSTINEIINEVGVFLQVEITKFERTEYKGKTSGGKDKIENLYDVTFLMTWVNTDKTEEQIELPWFAAGVNGVEKGLGSAITYGTRYFLQTQFLIANDKDDVDALPHVELENKAKLEAETKQQAETQQAIMDGVDGYLMSVDNIEKLTVYKTKLRIDLKGQDLEFQKKVGTKLLTHERMLEEKPQPLETEPDDLHRLP